MAENRTIGGQQTVAAVAGEEEFKRQRAQYLAERKARQLEAQQVRRREFGGSSSEEEPPARRQPVLIKENLAKGERTDSSSSPPPQESLFRAEREKYKRERMVRRQEAVTNRKMEFGSSSSSEDGLPLHPRARPVLRAQEPIPSPSPNLSPTKPAFRLEEGQFGFVSLDLRQGKEKEKEGASLVATVRLKQKKEAVRERYEVEVPSSKGNNLWTERWLQFRENAVALGERVVPLYDVNKAKMIFEPTQAGSLRIKLTVAKEDIFLAASPKKLHETYLLDQFYVVFARLLSLKLQLMGRQARKGSVGGQGVVGQGQGQGAVGERVLRQARLVGKVRKNSFFGGWEQQTAVASSAGLAIYKEGKEKPTLSLAPGSVRQIWTRFQFERDNLVLKFLHGHSKVELSVPLESFTTRDNWLYQLYALAPK